MVGDSAVADGAPWIERRVAIVQPLPTTQRPDALLGALADHGLVSHPS